MLYIRIPVVVIGSVDGIVADVYLWIATNTLLVRNLESSSTSFSVSSPALLLKPVTYRASFEMDHDDMLTTVDCLCVCLLADHLIIVSCNDRPLSNARYQLLYVDKVWSGLHQVKGGTDRCEISFMLTSELRMYDSYLERTSVSSVIYDVSQNGRNAYCMFVQLLQPSSQASMHIEYRASSVNMSILKPKMLLRQSCAWSV